jgi:hypothetical protein
MPRFSYSSEIGVIGGLDRRAAGLIWHHLVAPTLDFNQLASM